ncbi:MAG: zinc-dependent alcohol dehydrogenase family protein [Steroidobacteraceae bacterium]
MKAWQIKDRAGIDGLSLEEVRAPRPGPEDIVVRVRAVSLNYRDLVHVHGLMGADQWPLVPCSDGAGEVIAVGDRVDRFRVGDRVVGTFFQDWINGPITEPVMESALGGTAPGVLTEQVTLKQQGALHVPADWSFAQAATLPCAALTAWHALVTRGRVHAGQTVLVLGTGGVSLFALQIARMHGARVILTSGSDAKLERARELGAAETINYLRTPDWEQQVLELTGGRGVDQVVEVGGAGTFEKSCAATRFGGQVWLIGVLTGFQSLANPLAVLRRSLTVQGIYVGSREMFEAMNAAFAMNRLVPVIDRSFAFEDAQAALRCMEAGQHFGKLVIELGD